MIGKFIKKAASFGFDGFLPGIISVIFLAYLFPFAGAKDSLIPLDEIAQIGVSIIFFFYGLKLNPIQLKAGLSNWKLHLMVHLSTFVVFPVIILLLHKLIPNIHTEDFWTGIFYLTALPSTVSSSVVMVSIARGNIPAAIFNASISSLLGVFITPIWMEVWFSETAKGDFELGGIFLKLILQVLLPVLLGLIFHNKYSWFAEKYKVRLKQFDQSIILLIIFNSFCESFTENVFAALSINDLLRLTMFSVALFFVIISITNFISNLLNFSKEDKITLMFCGSKKSLVHGTVMSKILFPGSDVMGVILLPLMIYHTSQLVICSILANKFAREDR
ncbi:Bile acid:sodium symporter [Pseudopedobacter saltans DSM 12145]|uniref:Bile acid:sodium symporter n=1 Tax=Pseudopedobacter saltans (strain ATCC 51119 / DSM 12145 / JCM 21818 / CCUG 39354 / LMG 10337 / NBRC 100064 / NCIMB 13643) TaxID=762903 RepID=F0S937_PSESL|nr:bile acid:sodium symporter family protein [Pseudopedobacter saltans]ADY51335.1 Bile acid:sodium symporter [Pseudopedobacter saltans DSM 12145]